MSCTGCLLKCVLTTKSCLLLCAAAGMAQLPSTFGNWYLVTFRCRYRWPSSQSPLRTPQCWPRKQQQQQNVESEHFPVLHQNCGTVCPALWEDVWHKAWRPPCLRELGQLRLCTSDSAFHFSFLLLLLFFFFFLEIAVGMPLQCGHTFVLYKFSLSSSEFQYCLHSGKLLAWHSAGTKVSTCCWYFGTI